ncbi:MAG: UDP-N-acetylglucosamine 2-epimerase (hydrolyzing) [Bacteroidetes bacterium]|nr:UDP-N-acetylglucosamine 2-epimerase (hydrolyzing) [Bacteroidota bacterium]
MKKICVFTGSRAEYGLLKPLMKLIKSDKDFQLQIIASGMHLSPEFGLTFKQIEQDGFVIDEKVEMLLSSDTPTGIAKSMGVGMIGYTEALKHLNPDLLVLLGDRFETFSIAATATVFRIPVAHLHGGEATFGAFDEAFRHSITKMSHLHFVSTEEYRNRVIQLGENPNSVFNVGAIGIDDIYYQRLLTKSELEERLAFSFNKRNYLVVYHPVTLEKDTSRTAFQNISDVLDKEEDANIIFIYANADTDGRAINQMIDKYVSKHVKKAVAFPSLERKLFLSLLKKVDAIIGNSSSGIIEAPSLKTATINIGDRQKGRVQGNNVINCDTTEKSIEEGLKKSKDLDFQKELSECNNPYGDGKSARKILNTIKNINLENILKKEFYKINFYE